MDIERKQLLYSFIEPYVELHDANNLGMRRRTSTRSCSLDTLMTFLPLITPRASSVCRRD